MTAVGVVAIGRNEGERLRRCLVSLRGRFDRTVYVDSGSTDGSATLARELGADVVDLDMSVPFTAARARNEGYRRLRALEPELELVQFIDGDCELQPGWLPEALEHIRSHPGTAVVCGRRRELFREASLYNRLCDIEWDTPIGKAAACGGDALVRAAAFDEVGGYDPSVIAGEEPDMCYRMAARGWETWRIDVEMTLHDAAMTRFSQWWTRNVRSGHASAEALRRRGLGDVTYVKRVTSNAWWAMPLAWPLWPVLWWRAYRRQPDPAYAAFIVLGKLPHMQGQLKFWIDRARGAGGKIIEYK